MERRSWTPYIGLVTRAPASSLRPACWRTNIAAWAAKGKPIFSGATGRVSMERLSWTPLFFSTVRARVSRGGRGGKTRWGNGNQFFDVLAQSGLFVFDGQQIIGPVLQHRVARGLILGMQRVQGHTMARQFQFREEFPRHWYFVGLGVHQGAAQIKLAGHGDGTEHRIPGAVVGLLAIHHDQILAGWTTAHL